MIFGVSSAAEPKICLRLHQIKEGNCTTLAARHIKDTSGRGRNPKINRALDLLDRSKITSEDLIVSRSEYGCSVEFLEGLQNRGWNFAVELRPSCRVILARTNNGDDRKSKAVSDLLPKTGWKVVRVPEPTSGNTVKYSLVRSKKVLYRGIDARLYAAQRGAINGVHPGTLIFISSLDVADPQHLLQALGWTRWIRPLSRRKRRSSEGNFKSPAPTDGLGNQRIQLKTRANLQIAQRLDESTGWLQEQKRQGRESAVPLLQSQSTFNVVELFAGAGGMGLGFLLAGRKSERYRLIAAAEANPIYVETLNHNHRAIVERLGTSASSVPERSDPTDLRSRDAMEQIRSISKRAGGAHIVIGGPPCQGFSSANRNSWHSDNPHNHLVDVFFDYVVALRPLLFVMENVQGILWTPKNSADGSALSVADHLKRRMELAGYVLFPKLLDAIWYGVPQHRSRFFLIGICNDIGYKTDDFGSWGPYPYPRFGPGTKNKYVTVREAIGDLPRIGNGCTDDEQTYTKPANFSAESFVSLMRRGAPRNVIFDHVTSRHADYVLDRYRAIPPGGNWENIRSKLTNYADAARTHSNIYRRLRWNEPAITIGHYRKSMLVHPSQHRGLSLREACRLQSFPDWFRFQGRGGPSDGLVHKQQQLANAVCPLLTEALAEYLGGN